MYACAVEGVGLRVRVTARVFGEWIHTGPAVLVGTPLEVGALSCK